ncbi:hypothetical protein [Aliiglaciecola sp. LCG003]|uniref:hypothetical protein n=1 Tax=Aliiglaciecola sp. LCG003 TaxID=3053655 RepID=UPI002572C193|nr:hypothetical protein [Aliiglaciecola sp. LCG003]WJG07814.1 hypothetical protein QR722_10595 [Aliiglaciecola sp. LCG003]
MSTTQLLEEIAINPSFKLDLLSENENAQQLATRAESEIENRIAEQGKIWCALFPNEEEEKDPDGGQNEDDAPEEDDKENKPTEVNPTKTTDS